jgi:hypothetical protein
LRPFFLKQVPEMTEEISGCRSIFARASELSEANEKQTVAKQWLRGLRSNRAASRFVLLFSAALVLGALGLVSLRMSRASLLPSKEDRFDVAQIFMAPMAKVCPEGATTLSVAAFETCLESLTLNDGARSSAFRLVAIPTLDESLKGRNPTLRQLLLQQGHEELEKSLMSREPFVIGMRIPRELVRVNQVGIEPNMLVFTGVQDARFCLGGKCPLVVSKYEQGVLLFPLAVDTVPAGEFVDVFLFGKDTVFAFGPALDNGFFVTEASKLYATKRLFPIQQYGRAIFLATLFIGLFLMAFGFAAIWSEFLDYGAFCYLTASFALFTLSNEPTFTRLSSWTLDEFYLFKSVSQINLFAAFVAFAMATNRTRGMRVFATVIALVGSCSAYVLMTLPSDSTQAIVRWGADFDTALRWGILVVPTTLITWGGIQCYLRFLEAKRVGPLSLKLDFQRRTLEQGIYASFILLIAFQLLSESQFWRIGTSDASRFAPSTGFLLFGIFTVIIYHSTAKLAKTHFRADGLSESARLKGRMATKAYNAWLAETRQGIMMQVDIKNSSIATSTLKSKIHVLMRSLNDAMRKSHSRLGYHWMLAKKNGDEWIVILSQKHADLKDDLEEVVQATRVDALEWKALVQSMAPECSLHINVFALTSYSLGSERQRTAPGQTRESNWDVIDFASREANYLMKWAGKSIRHDTMTIGATFSLFSEAMLEAAVSATRVASLISASGETNAENVLDADSMSLTLLSLPWETIKRQDQAA